MRAAFPLSAVLAALAAASVSARNLDYIDADGVTDAGGGPESGRMLVRTQTNGLVSASLLPPLADWSSRPVPGVLCVAPGAEPGGNGSPLKPFRGIQEAVDAASAGTAVVLAPAAYDASVTLPAGKTVTLSGFGAATSVDRLGVVVTGASDRTEIRLRDLRVGEASVSGRPASVRLSGTKIGTVFSATALSIVREDLGSSVSHVSTTGSGSVVQSYEGYAYVPRAGRLDDTAGQALPGLVLSSGTASVGSRAVAYVDDVALATGAVYVVVADLRRADSDLASSVASEAADRASADTAVSNALAAAVSGLSERVDLIGGGWSQQLGRLSDGLSDVRSSVDGLEETHRSDVTRLSGDISGVQTGYQTADASLNTSLRSYVSGRVTQLHTEVSGEIASGVEEAKSAARGYSEDVRTQLQGDITSLSGRVTALTTWKTETAAPQINGLLNMTTVQTNKINEIIDVLQAIHSGDTWSVPDKIR